MSKQEIDQALVRNLARTASAGPDPLHGLGGSYEAPIKSREMAKSKLIELLGEDEAERAVTNSKREKVGAKALTRWDWVWKDWGQDTLTQVLINQNTINQYREPPIISALRTLDIDLNKINQTEIIQKEND